MRTFLFVGNLKMNLLSQDEAEQYLSVLNREMQGKTFENTLGILCPPAVYLHLFESLPSGIVSGAQNASFEKNGPYTGEISPVMLKSDGIEYVILGHSERRVHFGETDEMVKRKVDAALKYLLQPIVCIGESETERKRQETVSVLEKQVRSVFAGLSKLQAEKIILAYEPRWAIGTDLLPTTTEIFEVRVLLRKILTELFDGATAKRIRILYGGSVKSAFLHAVSFDAEMDGVLVGRESLFPYEVVKMMSLFEENAKQEV
ncbi:MAG: triose-phosphate isomerase [Patescibacteria group bacterium]